MKNEFCYQEGHNTKHKVDGKSWLFILDLDGTLLSDSGKCLIGERDITNIKKLIDNNHVVCIATGRPWNSSKIAYHELGLDTIIANYNGAHIHNPSDYSFNPHISYLNLNDVLFVLGDKRLQNFKTNLAIEGPGWVSIEKKDKKLEQVFGFNSASKFRVGIDLHKIPLKPTGIIIDTKKDINVKKELNYLSRTYGDLVTFSSWSKGENLSPVLDMTSIGVSKGKVVSLLSRYYDIPIERTIAIGDGYNDLPMFKVAQISVTLQNATNEIKKRATYITTRSNKDNGISCFIEKFLGVNSKNFIIDQTKRRDKFER